jgi:spore coat protein SA
MATVYHLLDESEPFSERNGGALSRWTANVLRDGTEVVICPSYDATWSFPEERIYQLPYWNVVDRIHPAIYRMPWSWQKVFYRRVFHTLLRKLRAGDILYIHNRPESAAVFSTIADQHGIRIVLHMQNSLLLRANHGQLEALRKTPIVFCSEFLRQEALAAFPNHFEHTHVVYNGADANKFRPVNREATSTPTVIFTGRLVHYKGVHVLLEAMRMLEGAGSRVKCKILGGSAFGKSRPTRYIRNLHRLAPSNTELTGYTVGNALADALRKADIFCCPSIWDDPFPLAPLEAMATGLPVVASQTGGIREALAHGGGILVPPNNPQALAAAIEKLVKDATYRQELGAQARNSFRNHFLWNNIRGQYEQVIQGLRP